jgi:hypothetical protein
LELNSIFLPLLQGTAAFLLGLFFIFVRWPIVGIILEIYGFVFLFGLVDGFLLELYYATEFIIIHLSLMVLIAAVFGRLSKCSSTISQLLDGLYGLLRVSFGYRNSPSLSLSLTHTHTTPFFPRCMCLYSLSTCMHACILK